MSAYRGHRADIAGIVLPGPVYFLRLKVRVLWILDAGTEAWDLVSALQMLMTELGPPTHTQPALYH